MLPFTFFTALWSFVAQFLPLCETNEFNPSVHEHSCRPVSLSIAVLTGARSTLCADPCPTKARMERMHEPLPKYAYSPKCTQKCVH